MSDEDIRFKISADESGALNALQRLRKETLNNDQALKELGREGKMSGKALKDMASFLGPEFQILGDRIDHVSGALTDVKSAGTAAKVMLAGLVATAGFQVGKMIGDWVFETEKWNALVDEAIDKSAKLNDQFVKSAERRVDGMGMEELQKELVGIDQALSKARQSLANFDKAISLPFIGRTGEAEASIKQLKAFIEEQQNLRRVYMDAMTAKQKADTSEAKAAAEKLKQEAELAKQREKAQAEEQRRLDAQTQTLDALQLEIVRLKEGEEAYERLRMAKQGFNEATIETALRLKAEINELTELDKLRKEEARGDTRQQSDRPGGPLMAEQQRFLTRGTGMDPQKVIAESTKQTAKTLAELRELQAQAAARSRRHFEWLERQIGVE